MSDIVDRLTEMHTDYEAGRWRQYDAVKKLLLDSAQEIERLQSQLDAERATVDQQNDLLDMYSSRLGECERIARDWKDTIQFTHAKAALEKIERTARAVDRQSHTGESTDSGESHIRSAAPDNQGIDR